MEIPPVVHEFLGRGPSREGSDEPALRFLKPNILCTGVPPETPADRILMDT